MQNIICISAHPDDLELGMGGTISKYREHNIISVIFFPKGDIRKNEATNSMAILGVTQIHFYEDEINIRKMITYLDNIFQNTIPNQIYTHFYGDTHQDHKIVYDITMAAARIYKSCDIFMWENTIPGGINHHKFNPNVFITLSQTNIQDKIKALQEHKTQIVKYKNLCKFIQDKANMWGYHCDSECAEVFYAIKLVR